ncbi:MAG: M23 family metallopeptidase [Clostridia bacterium]|nr:M23 family metallopeptidase [Clostridia bacterium]
MEEKYEKEKKENGEDGKKKRGITLLQTVLCIVLCLLFKLLTTGADGQVLSDGIREKLRQTVSLERRTQVREGFLDGKQPVYEEPEADLTLKAVKLSYKSGKKKTKEEKSTAEQVSEADNAAYAMTLKAYTPAEGDISSRFGYRTNPVTGEYSLHSGIDIAASFGSQVKAAYYGRIERTGESEISGNFIVMSHPGGLETHYYHCGDIFVEPGNVIRGGEVIATVGDTGRSTGPHLHFEIRVNGVKINPEKVLDKYAV